MKAIVKELVKTVEHRDDGTTLERKHDKTPMVVPRDPAAFARDSGARSVIFLYADGSKEARDKKGRRRKRLDAWSRYLMDKLRAGAVK